MSEADTEATEIAAAADAELKRRHAAQATAFREIAGSYFTLAEFRCKCDVCQADELNSDWFQTEAFRAFMGVLGTIRSLAGFPFPVNSGHRCPAYNDQIYVDRGEEPGEHLEGPHTIGGADIGASFSNAYAITNLATRLDMGVGIHQRGDVADRYIHVDNQGPRIWTY
jgi:hypothetical protein